jgi:hypothetical protein
MRPAENISAGRWLRIPVVVVYVSHSLRLLGWGIRLLQDVYMPRGSVNGAMCTNPITMFSFVYLLSFVGFPPVDPNWSMIIHWCIILTF